jgi:hypothetical protein
LPEAADRVLLKALSYDANKRYRSARKFSDELAWALLKAKPKSMLHSLKIWPLAVTLLSVVLGVTLWIWRAPVKPGLSMSTDGATTMPQSGAPAVLGSERALSYGLNIVRQRDGKIINATGRETFDTGDKFIFKFIPAQAGALYIFNLGTSRNWHVLFPTRENNQLDSRIMSRQIIESKEYEFTNRSGEEKGAEKIWIVWASEPIKSLDEIVKKSVQTDLTVSDSSEKEVLSRFMADHGTPAPEFSLDKDQTQVTLKGRGEILVYLLELEHKDWK